jgi:hypothetical protein
MFGTPHYYETHAVYFVMVRTKETARLSCIAQYPQALLLEKRSSLRIASSVPLLYSCGVPKSSAPLVGTLEVAYLSAVRYHYGSARPTPSHRLTSGAHTHSYIALVLMRHRRSF